MGDSTSMRRLSSKRAAFTTASRLPTEEDCWRSKTGELSMRLTSNSIDFLQSDIGNGADRAPSDVLTHSHSAMALVLGEPHKHRALGLCSARNILWESYRTGNYAALKHSMC